MFGCVGAAYSIGRGATASILDHDGYVPIAVGSSGVGTVMAVARKNAGLGFGCALVLTGAMSLLHYNGNSLSQQTERNRKKFYNYEKTLPSESH